MIQGLNAILSVCETDALRRVGLPPGFKGRAMQVHSSLHSLRQTIPRQHNFPMMSISMKWLVWMLVVPLASQFSNAVSLSNQFGVPDSQRVWSALKYVMPRDPKHLNIMNELYPLVMGLDALELADGAFAVGLDIEELPVNIAVERLLDQVYESKSQAQLFALYYDLYPMGAPDTVMNRDYTLDNSNYFVLNGERHDAPDDVFYLKSGDLKKQKQVPDTEILSQIDDVAIGMNEDSPLLVLYGCPLDEQFEEFHRNMHGEAAREAAKFRFLWRSTCKVDVPSEIENEFPLLLSVKPGVPMDPLLESSLWDQSMLPRGFKNPSGESTQLTPEYLEDLDVKVTSLISNHYYETKNVSDTILYAQSIVNNFPLLASQLVDLPLNEKEKKKILQCNKDLTKKGIDYNLIGMFVNGQHMKLSTLDEYTLLNAINNEYKTTNLLTSLLHSTKEAFDGKTTKKVVEEYSTISLPHLQSSQPGKIDLHRIPGFSETVIYFNNIEKDPQYSELKSDISAFFEKSRFGELPEYKQNWNEIIFAIDFNDLDGANTREALAGLNRVLTVVTQGYPQRVGLLPLNSGSATAVDGDSPSTAARIINKICDLKKLDVEELPKFLEMLQEKGDSIKFKDPTLNSIMNTPEYTRQANNLQLVETSLIVNGEIYPFRINTWNYLISNVLKKDLEYIRKELNKQASKSGTQSSGVVDVRGILHLRSTTSRHLKYLPEYYADTLYTSMDHDELQNFDTKRIVTYQFDNEYNVLHTITLVGDFGRYDSLKRLNNLLKSRFKGIRIRLIHTGEVSCTEWKSLNKVSTKTTVRTAVSELLKSPHVSKSPSKVIIRTDILGIQQLSRWLPDIPATYLNSTAFMTLNGRFIHFEENEIPNKRQFDALIQREAVRTLNSIAALESVYPSFSTSPISSDFVESFSSILTRLYYHGDQIYNDGIKFTTETILPRVSISSLLKPNDFTIFGSNYNEKKIVEILIIVDPLEERTQTILSLVKKFQKLAFVNIKVVLLPTEKLTITPIERIFIDTSKKIGDISENVLESFEIDFDVPSNLILTNGNVVDSTLLEVFVSGNKNYLSEGLVDGISGVHLELIDSDGVVVDHLFTMKTFGYGQFHVKHMGAHYTVRVNNGDSNYDLVGISLNGFSDFQDVDSFDIVDFVPHKLYVKVAQREEKPVDRVHLDDSKTNIFTVLQDLDEEEEYKKMVLTTLAGTRQFVGSDQHFTFWLLDAPFLSESLKRFISEFNSRGGELQADIRLVRYDWPNWLRPQRFRHRRMAVSKLLFLDVIFPSNISHLIYMSPKAQTIDPIEVLQESRNKKALFSLFRMKGKGYWSEGYWKKIIHDNGLTFYSIEPVFVINLVALRKASAGDILRLHYQRLSTDVQSLSNIDQDLLNNIQMEVPLGSLQSHLRNGLTPDTSFMSEWLKTLDEAAQTSVNKSSDYSEDDSVDDYLHDEL